MMGCGNTWYFTLSKSVSSFNVQKLNVLVTLDLLETRIGSERSASSKG